MQQNNAWHENEDKKKIKESETESPTNKTRSQHSKETKSLLDDLNKY